MSLFNKKSDDTEPRRRRAKNSGKSPVFSYYQNRDTGEPRSTAVSDRSRGSAVGFLRHLPSYIAGVVIVGSLLFSMTLTTSPKVIVVNDQEKAVQAFLRSPEAYQSIMQAGLKSSMFNRTKLTIDTSKVAATVKEQLPEATDVSITLPLLGRNPVIYVRIAEPTLLLTNDTQQTYVIDEQGRAVIESSQLPNVQDLNLIPVIDKSGLSLEAGKSVLPQDQISFMKEVKDQLAGANIKIKQFVLPAKADELHATPVGLDYYIKFNFLQDPREQVGRYLAVKKELSRRGGTPNEYIDVRVPDRAYVK